MSDPRETQREPQRENGPSDGDERRRWPRAHAEWPITIALEDGYHEARLRDVSGSGLCFFLDRPIREMTLLQVQLRLPDRPRTSDLRCRGVVVRCQRVSPRLEHYEVAVFLDDIAREDRALLESYVARAPSRA